MTSTQDSDSSHSPPMSLHRTIPAKHSYGPTGPFMAMPPSMGQSPLCGCGQPGCGAPMSALSSSLGSLPQEAGSAFMTSGHPLVDQSYILGATYGREDCPEVLRSFAPPNGLFYSIDGAYPYSPCYGTLDPRRKNATREATNTLKAWLYEHRKNPYPTKGEKIMLAILTRMTLTQVSTWFANARRRLKKEKKIPWLSDKEDDEDDGDCSTSNVDLEEKESDVENDEEMKDLRVEDSSADEAHEDSPSPASSRCQVRVEEEDFNGVFKTSEKGHVENRNQSNQIVPDSSALRTVVSEVSQGQTSSTQCTHSCCEQTDCCSPHHVTPEVTQVEQPSSVSSSKPRIWSIADVVNCSSSTSNSNANRSSIKTSTASVIDSAQTAAQVYPTLRANIWADRTQPYVHQLRQVPPGGCVPPNCSIMPHIVNGLSPMSTVLPTPEMVAYHRILSQVQKSTVQKENEAFSSRTSRADSGVSHHVRASMVTTPGSHTAFQPFAQRCGEGRLS